MPTKKLYKKIIEVCQELIKLGLNGWTTELTITDEKKRTETGVKVSIKLKKKKLKKEEGCGKKLYFSNGSYMGVCGKKLICSKCKKLKSVKKEKKK